MKRPFPRLAGPIVAALFIAASALGIAHFRSPENDMFMPHAHCYLFNRALINLHGYTDLAIGLAYVSISATLVILVIRARRELPFHWMMLAFATFIVACGATHFMEIWTLQAANPPYWLSGWIKLVTASASVVTAALLPPLIPKVIAVLRSAKASAEREEELSKAYLQLEELYRKATQRVPKKETLTTVIETLPRVDSPDRLADLARGVTEHARELERAKQAAESANHAKDQFLAVLSHELRTPLTPALAAASSLENSPLLDSREVRESLSMIRRNIELEARLVDDLLDLTRISRGKLRIQVSTIDLHETIQHAVDMCRSDNGHLRAEITMDLRASQRNIRGDAARLAQVFWNLILNAVKFTPPDGHIRVTTSNPSPGLVRIVVSDNGIGIEPEKLPHIFEPFQQGEESTARKFGGLGLGLSVAQGLVKAHGGSIRADSEGKGMGTTFTIELATTAQPAISEHEPKRPNTSPAPVLRILIVEDHADTRRVLERILTRCGHTVETAGSVEEGLVVASQFEPTVLISDIGLPDGTGVDLLSRLSRVRPIPAIAMSGYGMESDIDHTRNAGFKDHLVKPVSAERLKEAIDRLVTRDFSGS